MLYRMDANIEATGAARPTLCWHLKTILKLVTASLLSN